jgi:hypothetical protein
MGSAWKNKKRGLTRRSQTSLFSKSPGGAASPPAQELAFGANFRLVGDRTRASLPESLLGRLFYGIIDYVRMVVCHLRFSLQA